MHITESPATKTGGICIPPSHPQQTVLLPGPHPCCSGSPVANLAVARWQQIHACFINSSIPELEAPLATSSRLQHPAPARQWLQEEGCHPPPPPPACCWEAAPWAQQGWRQPTASSSAPWLLCFELLSVASPGFHCSRRLSLMQVLITFLLFIKGPLSALRD